MTPTAPAPPDLAAAALWYARHGVAVFPLLPGDKRPHPGSRGFHDATTDPDRISEWWTRSPRSNIGAPTGSRFDVVDFDGQPGADSLARLTAAGLLDELSPVGRSTTPRGVHLFVRPTGAGSTAGIVPGVDFRGVGGYVVLAPSVRDDGERYAWTDPPDVAGLCEPGADVNGHEDGHADGHEDGQEVVRRVARRAGLLAAPVERVRPALDVGRATVPPRSPDGATSAYALAALAGECDRLRAAPVGTRNATLNASTFALGTLVGAGELDEQTVVDNLAPIALGIGLDPVETRATIASGLRAGIAAPRAPRAPLPPRAELGRVIVHTGPAETADGHTAPHEGGASDEDSTARDYATLVEHEAARIRVRRDAQRLVADEDRRTEPAPPPIDAGSLAAVLARPDEPPMRADGLVPSDGSLLLVAQRKTGKTTWCLNYARALLSGGDLLGRFPVIPVTGRVAFLNYEVSGHQLARWASDVGVPDDRLFIVNLRGRRNPLTNPDDRARLVELLIEQDVEAVMVDPFGRAYTGTSQNDAGEVGSWLVDLDLFTRGEVGARDLVLTAHAGWNGERVRGASALEDWADSIVTLTRDPAEGSPVYMRAMGRDVDVGEDELLFDHGTRALTMRGTGSRAVKRKARQLDDLMGAIVTVLTEHQGDEGMGVAAIHRQLVEDGVPHSNGDESRACAELVRRGVVAVTSGRQGRKLHRLRESGVRS